MNVLAINPETLRRTLEGRTIVSYEADEMALWERGADGRPVFRHARVPCVQCGSITIAFEGGTRFTLQTNLFGDEWGLLIAESSPEVDELEVQRDQDSIYRRAALERFPVGPIKDVVVHANGNHVRAIAIEFAQGAVTMVAGEFDEQFDGSLRLVLDDESILFFPNEDGLAWAEAQIASGRIDPL